VRSPGIALMGMPEELLVLAPTWVEWRAVARALSRVRVGPAVSVVRCGVALRRFTTPPRPIPVLITCGVAGGLDPELEPGAVVVAASVAFEDGEAVACDPVWTEALASGARSLGLEPLVGPVLTSRRMLVGQARRPWADRGFVAAEMETGLLAPSGARLASLRVILDAPARELASSWSSPLRAGLDPRRWREAVWLAGRAPAFAAQAGRCLAAALASLPAGIR